MTIPVPGALLSFHTLKPIPHARIPKREVFERVDHDEGLGSEEGGGKRGELVERGGVGGAGGWRDG